MIQKLELLKYQICRFWVALHTLNLHVHDGHSLDFLNDWRLRRQQREINRVLDDFIMFIATI